MSEIFLYNTLTRQKEKFVPINKDQIGLYTCGPTVYNFAHIGNLRAYIFADILARTLKYGFGNDKLRWVMNITDVDDKTIRDSRKKYPETDPMEALRKFTKEYEGIFWQDLQKMNIMMPNIIPHAADDKYVSEMQRVVVKILDKGFAYIKDGSVYFNVYDYAKKYKYGQLVNLDLSNLKTGTRIDLDDYDKENVQDFVLWKGKKDGEPFWDFEINGESLPGRPGWHIECSAMGGLELEMPFDIHTGGIDLAFPHHEDEIAQNTIAFNNEKAVHYWLHNEMLMVEGRKMSKRLGNFYSLRDIEDKGFSPMIFRYLSLQTHYRKMMDFSWTALEAAQNGYNHLRNQIRQLKITNYELKDVDVDFKDKFLEVMGDDLNTPQALALLQEVLKSDLPDEKKLATVLDFDKVLGLKLDSVEIHSNASLPEDVQKIVDARSKARAEKNWPESDRLRDEIQNKGYVVEDGSEGMRVFKK